MNAQETRSILTIALLAAFADGMKDERERAAVKRVAEVLGPDAGFDFPALYRDVLLTKPDLATVAAGLQSEGARQLAYEMAVGVCDADGAQGPAEREFLQKLAAALGINGAAAAAASAQADEIADAAFDAGPASATAAAAAGAAGVAASTAGPQIATGTVTGRSTMSDAEMDKTILNASITNAALELLPG